MFHHQYSDPGSMSAHLSGLSLCGLSVKGLTPGLVQPPQHHPQHQTSTPTSSSTTSSSSGSRYKCHLCNFENGSLEELHAHMPTHFNNKCPYCDYTSRTEGRLKHHVANFHSETPPDSWAGNRVVSVTHQHQQQQQRRHSSSGDLSSDHSGMMSDHSNQDDQSMGGSGTSGQQCTSSTGSSHCKPRKHRCKQCSFVAMNKEDFWEHSKQHIKEDKRLSCPKCPFVTEFKHHLEYHLRNHEGSKPFQCEKCNYCCVNKSMLNSHLKSHSNIYQYRCDDCSYATKYCHSLKLHLRKYTHKPATVLTLDGNPNPTSIIDVYGTRRGPRPKKQQIPQQQTTEDISPVRCHKVNSSSNNHRTKAKISSSSPSPTSRSSPGHAMDQSVVAVTGGPRLFPTPLGFFFIPFPGMFPAAPGRVPQLEMESESEEEEESVREDEAKASSSAPLDLSKSGKKKH